MNFGSYFTDLMSNGFTNPLGYGAQEHKDSPITEDSPLPEDTTLHEEPILSEETPLSEDLGAAVVERSQGRSKNFSVQEDLLLVSAWLNVSMDAINGADQPCSTYYQRIHA